MARIGGNQTNKPRQPNDLYPTPRVATLALLKHYTPSSKMVWEPACGGMDIVQVLVEHGYRVESTDITTGHDIFKSTRHIDYDIITNPPYSLALQFVEKCLELTAGNVCMLMPIGFMTSAKRRPLLQSGKLKRVIILTNRLKIQLPEEVISSQFNHAWYIFKNDEVKSNPELTFE